MLGRLFDEQVTMTAVLKNRCCQSQRFACLPADISHGKPGQKENRFEENLKAVCLGWGGRIRTYDTRYQKPMPYHLATPHQRAWRGK